MREGLAKGWKTGRGPSADRVETICETARSLSFNELFRSVNIVQTHVQAGKFIKSPESVEIKKKLNDTQP